MAIRSGEFADEENTAHLMPELDHEDGRSASRKACAVMIKENAKKEHNIWFDMSNGTGKVSLEAFQQYVYSDGKAVDSSRLEGWWRCFGEADCFNALRRQLDYFETASAPSDVLDADDAVNFLTFLGEKPGWKDRHGKQQQLNPVTEGHCFNDKDQFIFFVANHDAPEVSNPVNNETEEVNPIETVECECKDKAAECANMLGDQDIGNVDVDTPVHGRDQTLVPACGLMTFGECCASTVQGAPCYVGDCPSTDKETGFCGKLCDGKEFSKDNILGGDRRELCQFPGCAGCDFCKKVT